MPLGVLGLARVKLCTFGFRLGAVGNERIRFFSSSSSKSAFGNVCIFGSVEWSVLNASYSSSNLVSIMDDIEDEPTDGGGAAELSASETLTRRERDL